MFFVLLLLAGGHLACRRSPAPEDKSDARVHKSETLTEAAAELPAVELQEPIRAACEAFRAEASRPVEAPLDPASEGLRIEILGRSRAVPIYFLEPPEPEGLAERALVYRRELEQSSDAGATILRILRETRRELELRRQVFLNQGYLFSMVPPVATRMSQILRFDHLFDAPKIRVHRGDEVFELVRQKDRYRREGEETDAALLLFDRIDDLSGPLPPALHADFTKLQEEVGFRSARVTSRTKSGLWVELTYGGAPLGEPVTTVAHVSVDEEGRTRLDCEEVLPAQKQDLELRRSGERSLRAAFLPLKNAIDSIVEHRLPFDEPRTEYGQEDGKLRLAFAEAYRKGAETYEYNGDRYYVFDNRGRVRLPEVCVDFITDAFDWATGGSWAPRGAGRKRVKGALYFPSLGMENPRSVESLALFATKHPHWFDVYWVPKEEQVRLSNRTAFFASLAKRREVFRLGDVVFINGLRDDERYHYHSFFLYEMDPLTGFPILLAANAGPPQMRTWEGEMQNAPRRFVVARLRVRPEIFERAYEQARKQPGVPLVLEPEPTADLVAQDP